MSADALLPVHTPALVNTQGSQDPSSTLQMSSALVPELSFMLSNKMPACKQVKPKLHKSATSVLSFIANYQLKSDYDSVKLIPTHNTKVTSSKLSYLHTPVYHGSKPNPDLIKELEHVTTPFTSTSPSWYKGLKPTQTSHVFVNGLMRKNL